MLQFILNVVKSPIPTIVSLLIITALLLLICAFLRCCWKGITSTKATKKVEGGTASQIEIVVKREDIVSVHYVDESKKAAPPTPVLSNTKFQAFEASPELSINHNAHRKPRRKKRKEEAVIIIAVDASRTGFEGYCVDHPPKFLKYYYVEHQALPQKYSVCNLNNSGELEMKNVLYALHQFRAFIRGQKLILYTDNPAINSQRNEHARKVYNFLKRLQVEDGVKLVNPKTLFVNRRLRPTVFQKYILPADMLSQFKPEEFLESIAERYPEVELGGSEDWDMDES